MSRIAHTFCTFLYPYILSWVSSSSYFSNKDTRISILERRSQYAVGLPLRGEGRRVVETLRSESENSCAFCGWFELWSDPWRGSPHQGARCDRSLICTAWSW